MSRILFVGDLNEYGRGFLRYRTLKEMGHDVVTHSHAFVSAPGTILPPTLLYRILWKLRLPLDDTGVNAILKKEVRKSRFDVIWIEKGNMVWPGTLIAIKKMAPGAVLMSCSEDDMYARHGHSLWYRRGPCGSHVRRAGIVMPRQARPGKVMMVAGAKRRGKRL